MSYFKQMGVIGFMSWKSIWTRFRMIVYAIAGAVCIVVGWPIGVFWMGGGAFFAAGWFFGYKNPQSPLPDCDPGITALFFFGMPILSFCLFLGIGPLLLRIAGKLREQSCVSEVNHETRNDCQWCKKNFKVPDGPAYVPSAYEIMFCSRKCEKESITYHQKLDEEKKRKEELENIITDRFAIMDL